MRTQTLAQLQTTVQEMCELGFDPNGNVTLSELTTYLNMSYSSLWGKLAQVYADDYNLSYSTNYLTTGQTITLNQLVALPADFFKLVSVDIAVNPNANRWFNCKRYMENQRNMLSSILAPISLVGYATVMYKLEGTNIAFIPNNSSQTVNIRFKYTPCCPTLVNPTDTLDGINGWEEFVLIDTCITVKDKRDQDCSVLMAKRQLILDRLQEEMNNRDAGEPIPITDGQAIGLGQLGGPSFGIGDWGGLI